MNRGYFGIGIYHIKNKVNIGTLWRSAYIYGASFVFTIGRRYEKQSSDTIKAYRHIPLWHFDDFEDFIKHSPYNTQIICIEITDNAYSLDNFCHPERAIYLLGAEDYGIPKSILRGRIKVYIPTARQFCLNVAVAGSVVMYDRFVKEGENGKRKEEQNKE